MRRFPRTKLLTIFVWKDIHLLIIDFQLHWWEFHFEISSVLKIIIFFAVCLPQTVYACIRDLALGIENNIVQCFSKWNLLFKFVQFFLIWKCVRLFLCSFCADMRLPSATVSLLLNVNGIGIVILINPLDHMILFINQALFAPYTVANFYIYTKLFLLLFSIWYLKCVLEHFFFTHALFQSHLLRDFSAILKSFCPLRGTRWYEIEWEIAITNPICTQLHRNMALL